MGRFKNSVIDQAFFKLALEGTITLEEARKILESYNGNKLDLLFLLNELIDSREHGKAREKQVLLENSFGSVKTKPFRREHRDRVRAAKILG